MSHCGSRQLSWVARPQQKALNGGSDGLWNFFVTANFDGNVTFEEDLEAVYIHGGVKCVTKRSIGLES